MSAPLRVFLAAALALSVAPAAPKKRRRAPVITAAELERRALAGRRVLENPGALVPFFERLSQRALIGPVHILHYGDSHTASDNFPDAIRRLLQARFGAGGPGFVQAGRPYAGFRRFDVRGAQSTRWRTTGPVARESDGWEGLAGVSITAQRAGETASLVAECERLTLYYLQQPGGGEIEFSVDGDHAVEEVATIGDLGPGYIEYAPDPGPHRFTVRTLDSGPVRLFGWTADNAAGVTYETLGINGAQATVSLPWEGELFAGHVAQRDPALIVLAYGTNEAVSPRWDAAGYEAGLREVLEKIRDAAPAASILVVGPPDCLYLKRLRRFSSGRLDEVISIQRAAAREAHCGFWNWRARMGGPGSVRQWVAAGLSQRDYVHMTAAGYRLAGELLFKELMFEYERFLALRDPAGAPEEKNQCDRESSPSSKASPSATLRPKRANRSSTAATSIRSRSRK
jgi:hypothetical protein